MPGNPTDWTGDTKQSTNWAGVSVNSTNWSPEDNDPSQGALLLQTGDNLLLESGGNILLQ